MVLTNDLLLGLLGGIGLTLVIQQLMRASNNLLRPGCLLVLLLMGVLCVGLVVTDTLQLQFLNAS